MVAIVLNLRDRMEDWQKSPESQIMVNCFDIGTRVGWKDV